MAMAGVDPWDPDALRAWLDEGIASTYELAAAHFVLAVFDPRGPAGPFDAMAALGGGIARTCSIASSADDADSTATTS